MQDQANQQERDEGEEGGYTAAPVDFLKHDGPFCVGASSSSDM
jgi:hypothetical protein